MSASTISASDFLLDRPFGLVSEALYDEWFDAAALYLDRGAYLSGSDDFKAAVNSCFSSLENHSSRTDQHLFRGAGPLYSSSRKSKRGDNASTTRPFLILNSDFGELGFSEPDLLSGADEIESSSKIRVFSPLFFLRKILTADDYLASEAYAHAIIRAEIFAAAARTFMKDTDLDLYAFVRSAISYRNVASSLSSIESYVQKRDTIYMRNATDFIVGNLLASQGYGYFTFAAAGASHQKARRTEMPLMQIDEFLRSRCIDFSDQKAYELRVSPGIDQLPSAAQLISELDGTPVAVPGMKTIFSGGIRSTEHSGAVLRVTGQSGSGKTTLALAACAALAPLGTKTFYLSCEEEPLDLIDRIHSVTPSFISNTRNYVAPGVGDESGWFYPFHLSSTDPAGNLAAAETFVAGVLDSFEENKVNPVANRPPGVAPFVVVLDGVHELVSRYDSSSDDQISQLHGLVEVLRSLNSLVILLSANIEDPAFKALDYLVDVVISLEGADQTAAPSDKVRNLRLQKTRRQYSYGGIHKYHISRNGGVRIFPNTNATLDLFKRKTWKEPDRSRSFDFLLGTEVADQKPWLRIYSSSHVLVTGKGSTGKASFALRLLSSPLISEADEQVNDMFGFGRDLTKLDRRRILIVSFLYPSSYYDGIIRRIQRARFVDRSSSRPTPAILHTVLPFYPGTMPGEVLLSKVTEELRRAVVQGTPYDGVLIDGLHNVFLQFPSIEGDTLIWPVLSEIFRRSSVTVVTTHAHFDVIGMDDDHHMAMDVRSTSNRSTPLLQSLVNSADYYLDVSPFDYGDHDYNEEESSEIGECAVIRVGTALGQSLPRGAGRFWNRSTLTIRTAADLGLFMGDIIQ